MRPNNNQNKRSRGRNNSGGRKHTNPLSRNFESNGPDVKIRGNASHIAEKYQQLARDAQASGDSVMAENYLQHAEHYFRILSAAQAQNPQRNDQSQPQMNNGSDDGDDDDNNDNASGNEDQGPAEVSGSNADQPAPAESAKSDADEAEAEKPARKPRERRPRRKPQPRTDDAPVDAAGAVQPDVGELPAFLTAGGRADAAE